MRKILLPTDFSDNAWSASLYALNFFEQEICTFYFLNSVALTRNMLSNLSDRLIKEMSAVATQELLDLKELAETSDPNTKHTFETILSTQDLYKAVGHACETHDIDLVVMGTKGATGAKEFFFGSKTVNVIMSIKACPVLLIPEEFDFVPPKQIAFPTDYNRFYNLKEVKPLKSLADLYQPKIRIVHITEEKELSNVQSFNLRMLKIYYKNYDFSLHCMPKYAEKAKEINDFIEELDIDVLAMVKYKHSFIEKIINEPVIKELGFHCKIPFLVIPE
ncbi:universal stress protein [Algibacter lectus]|uniref:UspA protein n=1 Tax=Algibacter lectus TaxID=221126 RepID=A0A090VCZ2_9FLAO|nr:universal stress protein [Algibacter lectus]GAL62616.1 UspA protein [Algibacter lectus]